MSCLIFSNSSSKLSLQTSRIRLLAIAVLAGIVHTTLYMYLTVRRHETRCYYFIRYCLGTVLSLTEICPLLLKRSNLYIRNSQWTRIYNCIDVTEAWEKKWNNSWVIKIHFTLLMLYCQRWQKSIKALP